MKPWVSTNLESALLSVGPSGHSSYRSFPDSDSDGPPMHVGKGIACAPWSRDGVARFIPPVPISYLAAQVGEPGVPSVSLKDRKQLAHWLNARNRKTLRFAFLFNKGQPPGHEGNSSSIRPRTGLARPAMYNVLNGAANELYQRLRTRGIQRPPRRLNRPARHYTTIRSHLPHATLCPDARIAGPSSGLFLVPGMS